MKIEQTVTVVGTGCGGLVQTPAFRRFPPEVRPRSVGARARTRTREAVKEAELALQLPVSGEPSALLLQGLPALDKKLIHDLQKAFGALDRIGVKPSGILDSETRRAIENAELEFGLPPDGTPDRDLLRLPQAQIPRQGGSKEKPARWIQVSVQELLVKHEAQIFSEPRASSRPFPIGIVTDNRIHRPTDAPPGAEVQYPPAGVPA